MGVAPLATRHVENARCHRQPEQLYEARRFPTIALGREQETVFQEIVGIEGRLPPLARFLQKKTGSRYAPNTDSIAARISYRVQ